MKKQGPSLATKDAQTNAPAPQSASPTEERQQDQTPPNARAARAARGSSRGPSPADLLALQRTVGNRATGRELAQRSWPARRPVAPVQRPPLLQRVFTQ